MQSRAINRHHVNLSYQEHQVSIHYREAEYCASAKSQQPTIILLHPSPLSSNFMLPLLSLFGETHHAIAWDAPGYGDSGKLPNPNQTLNPYVDCLSAFIDNLGFDNVILYGNATGAQLAIEFAKQWPAKVDKLILDNVAWFYPDEQQAMLASYFPDLSPKEDGQHIQDTWHIVTNLFKYFPWYEQNEQHRVLTPMPPVEVLQATFTDYIKAGATYADAYKAAIKNEELAQLQQVPVLTDIVIWQDSIIYPYASRLLTAELPQHIQLHQIDSGIDNRMQTLQRLLITAQGSNKHKEAE